MSEAGWGIVFVLGLAALIALLLAVLIWQVFKTQQARTVSMNTSTHDNAYRELAVRAIEAQEAAVTELTDLRGRVSELERILKEVG